MDALKVCGGVAAGIGTVAVLPVMGAIGSVTLLGALLGGTVGGVAGAILSEESEAGGSSRQPVEVDESGEANPWLISLQEISTKLDKDSFGDLVVALQLMERAASRIAGFSIASPDWMRDIREAVGELELSEKAKGEIDQFDGASATLEALTAKVLNLSPEAKEQASFLLDLLIPDEENNHFLHHSLATLRTTADEVVNLVKSLVKARADKPS